MTGTEPEIATGTEKDLLSGEEVLQRDRKMMRNLKIRIKRSMKRRKERRRK